MGPRKRSGPNSMEALQEQLNAVIDMVKFMCKDY
jgi:hypothetical protein